MQPPIDLTHTIRRELEHKRSLKRIHRALDIAAWIPISIGALGIVAGVIWVSAHSTLRDNLFMSGVLLFAAWTYWAIIRLTSRF